VFALSIAMQIDTSCDDVLHLGAMQMSLKWFDENTQMWNCTLGILISYQYGFSECLLRPTAQAAVSIEWLV